MIIFIQYFPRLIFQSLTGIIYKTQRAEVILQFKERPFLPNPFSLVYFVGLLFKKLMDKCVCKKRLYRSKIEKGFSISFILDILHYRLLLLIDSKSLRLLQLLCVIFINATYFDSVNKQNASFNAFRASLIEAECVGIYIRKKKQKAVSVTSLLEKLHT